MNKALRIATALSIAVGLAIPAEGLRQVAYRDPVGILTVCFGSTTDVDPRRVYSLDECHDRLDRDMLAAVETVDACVPDAPVQVLAAFSDAVYNLGRIIACDLRESTAARLLAAGEWIAACEQLPRWNRGKVPGLGKVPLPGLTKRRELERQVCLAGLLD